MKSHLQNQLQIVAVISSLVFMAGLPQSARADNPVVSQMPLSVGGGTAAPPLNMLVMGRDHKLYYEAYNDASDLNGDGIYDVGYKGHLPDDQGGITYFGYFDSYRCYSYDNSNQRFAPGAVTSDKTCQNAWSGDFLNYITTSRMDALRKVLYGGYRSTDTAGTEANPVGLTVLERSYIPQEAHSWGKEYKSIDYDGYDIADYAPLSQPRDGTRHLFGNVSLWSQNDGYNPPLLRVLNDTRWRLWEWTGRWSSDTGVTGANCGTDSATPCATSGTSPFPGHPNNEAEFDALELTYAIPANLFSPGGAKAVSVNCTNNQCNTHGRDDNYLTVASAKFQLENNDAATGNYQFCIEGDDAVDVVIKDSNDNVIGRAGHYGSHAITNDCSGSRITSELPLTKNSVYSIKVRHEDQSSGDSYRLKWRKTSEQSTFSWKVFERNNNGGDNVKRTGETNNNTNFTFNFYDLTPATHSSTITDYIVRVVVCDQPTAGCKQYERGLKPTGILHDYGEDDRMMFGLLSGSYANNTQGGVIRKNMASFKDEVNSQTGQFTDTVGIVKTIDRLRVVGLGGSFTYSVDCGTSSPNRGWVNNKPINNGECLMWGNPIAEMMYEALRYFDGAGSPRTEYNYTSTTAKDAVAPLNLPKPSWNRPYTNGGADGKGFLRCATPVMTVISDINPSYDGDLPGSKFNTAFSGASDPENVRGLNVSNEVDLIWNAEGAATRNVFIGESNGAANNAPTPKTAVNFSSLRGLSPEEPGKLGTFYSAGVARYGANNAIGGEKRVQTYSVALSSPLPSLRFEIGESKQIITVVPFAKSTSGTWGGTIDTNGNFQPTNQIVDYYVDEYEYDENGRTTRIVFSINYEDTEQGADHDLDAVVKYTFTVHEDSLQIELDSQFAAGGIHQYMGYVVSGSTKDGVYLDVRDSDTTSGSVVSYKFNTPQGRDPGYCDKAASLRPQDCRNLPLQSNRTFVPGTSGAAEVLNDPLWYAAKYGRASEIPWDGDGDGTPDNYFLVTNAGKLKEQLDRAFAQIVADTQNSGGVAASGSRATTDLMAYVPEYTSSDWSGDLRGHRIDQSTGNLLPMSWSAKAKLAEIQNSAISTQGDPTSGRNLYYIDPTAASDSRRKDFTLTGLGGSDSASQLLGLPTDFNGSVENLINYLRGDHSLEQRNNGTFRNRGGRLGDIFSQPVVLDRASYGYLNLPEDAGGGYGNGGYAKFVADKADRVPVVFAAANDGFVHAFNATAGTDGGKEIFAIAPGAVLGEMKHLASTTYTHRYYVDGTPTQGDAYLGNRWRSVLVGSTGAGGRSIYALDVTDPVAGDWDVLWEFTDEDLGLTMSTPRIALLPDGTWAAVFGGSGYGVANNYGYLYIVNLETGELIRKIQVNTEGTNDLPNGVSTPSLIDLDGDGDTDIIYAGDYYGNVWKFNLAGSSSISNVQPQLLFTATDTASSVPGAVAKRQAITGGVTASIHPLRGQMVFFGTGRYFLVGDNAAPSSSDQIQSFYGIWDDPSSTATVARNSLVEQTFTANEDGSRSASNNPVNWAEKKGWYIDLKATDVSANGERFIALPTVAVGRVFFTTFVSQGDQCEPGGSNWINSLWATSGAGGLGDNGLSSEQLGGSTGPMTSSITIVTGREGGDEGHEGCDPEDETCVDPGASDSDGDGEVDTDLGVAQPKGCILSVDILTAAGLRDLFNLSCGRQSWRQF